MKNIKQIPYHNNPKRTYGNKQRQQLRFHRLAQHDHGRQGQRRDSHHKRQDRAKLRPLIKQGLDVYKRQLLILPVISIIHLQSDFIDQVNRKELPFMSMPA